MTRNRPWTAVFVDLKKEPQAFMLDTGASGFGISRKAAASRDAEAHREAVRQSLAARSPEARQEALLWCWSRLGFLPASGNFILDW